MLIVYGDKTAFVIYGDVKRVTVVQNKEVADYHRGMFEYAWSMGSQPTKSIADFTYDDL